MFMSFALQSKLRSVDKVLGQDEYLIGMNIAR